MIEMSPDKNPASDLHDVYFKAGLQGTALIEIVVLAGIIPAAVLQFAGPAVADLIFTALILIPMLLGLRYGFFAGVAAAVLLAGVLMEVSHYQPKILPEFPKARAVILLIGGAIAGQFRDYWASHMRRIDSLATYRQNRLAQFTSTFYVLQVSHAQLERQLAGTVTSLRTSLQRLKQQLPTTPVGTQLPLGGIGSWLLNFLAEVGNLHAAALYVVNERSLLAHEPVVTIGDAARLSAFNPLLREALRTGRVTSIHHNDIGTGNVIAVVPLVDSLGHIHAVVSVNEMPFIAIHQRTFDLLGVIARQIGDILAGRVGALNDVESEQALRSCLRRSLINVHQDGLQVAVITCKIVEQKWAEQLVTLCVDVNRGMDYSWLCHDRLGRSVIVKILPMADENAAQSQLQRLRQNVANQYGNVIAMKGIESRIWMMEAYRNADEVLALICLACDIQMPTGSAQKAHHLAEI
jgi:hypothetical protein